MYSAKLDSAQVSEPSTEHGSPIDVPSSLKATSAAASAFTLLILCASPPPAPTAAADSLSRATAW